MIVSSDFNFYCHFNFNFFLIIGERKKNGEYPRTGGRSKLYYIALNLRNYGAFKNQDNFFSTIIVKVGGKTRG